MAQELTKEQEDAILTLKAENPSMSDEDIINAVLGGGDESLLEQAWEGFKTNAPKALNALDIPSGLARTALLNPDELGPLYDTIKNDLPSILESGIADPETLVNRKGSEKGALTSLFKRAQGDKDASGFRKGAANFAAGVLLDPFVVAGAAKGPLNAVLKGAANGGSGILNKTIRGVSRLIVPPSRVKVQEIREAQKLRKGMLETMDPLEEGLFSKAANQVAKTVLNPYRVVGGPVEAFNKALYDIPFMKTNKAVTGKGMGSLKGNVEMPSDVAYKYGQLVNSPEGFDDTVKKIAEVRKPIEEEAIRLGKTVDLGPVRAKGEAKALTYYTAPTPAEHRNIIDLMEMVQRRTPYDVGGVPVTKGTHVPFALSRKEHGVVRDAMPRGAYVETTATQDPLKKQVLEALDDEFLAQQNLSAGGEFQKTGKEMQAALGGKQKGAGRPMRVSIPALGPLNYIPDITSAGDITTALTGLYGRARRANPAFTDAAIKESLQKFLDNREK
jgi:hypothetical protein